MNTTARTKGCNSVPFALSTRTNTNMAHGHTRSPLASSCYVCCCLFVGSNVTRIVLRLYPKVITRQIHKMVQAETKGMLAYHEDEDDSHVLDMSDDE